MSLRTQQTATASYDDYCASESAISSFKIAQIQTIEQCIALLSNIENEHYVAVLSPIVSGSIGQHVRHILDHYRALMNSEATGVVDYDNRERNTAIEVSSDIALSLLKPVVNWIECLTPIQLSSALEVSTQCSVEDELVVCVPSSLERELLYVSSHTIHHFSLISIICKLQNIDPPENFGIAPATLSYRRAIIES